MTDLVVKREFDDGLVVKFVSPRSTLSRIFGLPPEPQYFGLSESERGPDLCLCPWVLFKTASLAFKGIALVLL